MDSSTETTQVFLIPAEAAKFLQFQAYYDTFTILVDSGVFNVRNGSVALHFDSNGALQTVQRSDFLYSRRHA